MLLLGNKKNELKYHAVDEYLTVNICCPSLMLRTKYGLACKVLYAKPAHPGLSSSARHGCSHSFEFILEFKWCYYLRAQSLEGAHRDKVAYVYL